MLKHDDAIAMNTPDLRIVNIRQACNLLRKARNHLAAAGAPKALAKARKALKSAEGAARNADAHRFDDQGKIGSKADEEINSRLERGY